MVYLPNEVKENIMSYLGGNQEVDYSSYEVIRRICRTKNIETRKRLIKDLVYSIMKTLEFIRNNPKQSYNVQIKMPLPINNGKKLRENSSLEIVNMPIKDTLYFYDCPKEGKCFFRTIELKMYPLEKILENRYVVYSNERGQRRTKSNSLGIQELDQEEYYDLIYKNDYVHYESNNIYYKNRMGSCLMTFLYSRFDCRF